MTNPSPARSIRAIVIEDNTADVYLIGEALKQEFAWVELEIFNDGEAASKLVDRLTNEGSQRPDIILLDLNLPRCDGKEVLHKLRQMPGEQTAPVIVMTSSNSPKDRDDCLSLGAACYFRKSSDLSEFMKIASVIRDLVQPG
jgi:CheY-like chemotaxis protein